jgi:peptide/nickel transport system permease protein
MAAYLGQRLAVLAVSLGLLTIVVFGLTQALPGDVARMIVGQFYDPVAVDALRKDLGLNDPLYVQYGRWASHALQGDFGRSLVIKRPVAPIVADAFLKSLSLGVCTVVVVGVVGTGLGVIGAVKRNSALDHATAILAFLGISVPEFFTGILLIIVFSAYLHWLPSTGYVSPTEDPLGWAQHSVLPIATLSLALTAHIARLTRSSMLEVLQSTYVRAARARGLNEFTVLTRHALRNALLPTITILALDFAALVGEFVVVETVFAYPGLGRLTIYAIQQRDLPLIQACILVSSAGYLVANLVADLLYAYLNPRIRYGGESI